MDTENLYLKFLGAGGKLGSLAGTKKGKDLIGGMMIGGMLTKTAGFYFQAETEKEVARGNALALQVTMESVKYQHQLSKEQFTRFREKFTGTVAARTAKMGLEFTGSPIEVLVDGLTQVGIDEAISNYNFAIQESRIETARDTERAKAKLAGYSMIANIVSTVASTSASLYGMKEMSKPAVKKK